MGRMNAKKFIKNLFQSTFLATILFVFTGIEAAENPPPAKEPIKIGTSTVLAGPSKDLGINITKGIELYFAKVNAEGGIDGHPLELIKKDDQYEPIIAGKNMRKLINEDHVLAAIGNMGSPNAQVTVPIANELHTLLYGAFSGAAVLRKTPPDRYVINFRASYDEEPAAIIKGLLSIGIKPEEIAFFTQNDAYGDAVYSGAMKALKAAGYPNPESLPLGRYTRNTFNVESGLSAILTTAKERKLNIKVIITAALGPENTRFFEVAHKYLPNVFFVAVPGYVEMHDYDKQGINVVVTRVEPPLDQKLPGVEEYLQSLKKYSKDQNPDYVVWHGYLLAKIFVIALKKAAQENNLTREGIIDAFETFRDVDVGIGTKITIDKNNHQALHIVWPVLIKDGKYVTIQWDDLKKMGIVK